MKKLLYFNLLLIVILLFTISINALEASEEEKDATTQSVLSLFENRISQEELQDLQNENYWAKGFTAIDVENKPIMKIYRQNFFDFGDKPLEDIIAEAEQGSGFFMRFLMTRNILL